MLMVEPRRRSADGFSHHARLMPALDSPQEIESPMAEAATSGKELMRGATS
jgi:hypothetical protein